MGQHTLQTIIIIIIIIIITIIIIIIVIITVVLQLVISMLAWFLTTAQAGMELYLPKRKL